MRLAAMAAGTAIGMLTKKHQRHDRYWVRKPPSSSPMAAPPPAMAPKTANAFARSFSSWKVTVINDNAAGASMAPKTPCSARPAKSSQPACAAPPMTEASAKPDSAMIRTFLRPT